MKPIWILAAIAVALFGSPLVIPLRDGTYSCERVGAPVNLAPPNVEVVNGEVIDAYNSFGPLDASSTTKEYDFPWRSSLKVTLDGGRYLCSL